MFQSKINILFLSLGFACDRSGIELIPETNGDFDSVVEAAEADRCCWEVVDYSHWDSAAGCSKSGFGRRWLWVGWA